jgi:hypothetical protein
MKTSRILSLILVASASLLFGQHRLLDVRNQVTVSERRNEIGVRSLIVVDRDDAIREIDVGLPNSAGPVVVANLGARITHSGRMEIGRYLPKEKVATAARRFTLRSGEVLHVVIAWGHSSVMESLEPQCSMYIYREHAATFDEIFSEELGDELDQFILEDINHDGKPEIMVTTRSGAIQQMLIWQIEPDGAIRELQRIDGYEVHTLADRFMGDDTGIFVADKSQKPKAGDLCFETAEYTWSRRLKKFTNNSR